MGASISGLGTSTTVLQMGETTTRTASTAETGTMNWSSSNTAVATVDSATGMVTAVAPGTTTIRYTSSNSKTNHVTVTVYPAPAAGLTPAVPAPSTVIGWGSNPTGFTPPETGQTIRWSVANGTGSASINATSGAVRGVAAGDVTVVYKITETATGIVAYKSVPVTVTVPNTPRVNTSAPYIDGGTIPGNFELSTNVTLTVAIQGENNTVVTFSNPRSSDESIATATITGPNPSGHRFLDVAKVGSGAVNITFDYTDIHGATGTMTWTFNFQ